MSGVVVVNQLTAEIVDGDGYSAVIQNGISIPSNTSALLIAGSDGYVVRFIRVNDSGALRVDPVGNTIQPVSGTVDSVQSGIWQTRLHDGYGSPVPSRSVHPDSSDVGLVVRVASASADGYLESLYSHEIPNVGGRSSVLASVSTVTLLAENLNRKGSTVFNDSNKTLYLALGNADATTTNYTIQIGGGGYYETPFGFTGRISGIWSGASGAAYISELI